MFGSLGYNSGPGKTPSGFVPWALPGATMGSDFLNNRGYNSTTTGTAASFLTTSRGSPGYAENNAGLYTQFSSNTPRITEKGLLVEDGCTNIVLWCRDLTNAAWVKTTTTVALNQTGIDGIANSASSLTATGANSTVLQSITDASTSRWQSAFVKRITGSGTIQMTMDGGTTWTTVTVSSTTTWSRVQIPTQTLANPQVGFRIVTSGDAIAVDFVQNEKLTSGLYQAPFPTSPILTTTTSQARSADLITYTSPPLIDTTNFSMYCDGMFYAAGASAFTFPAMFNGICSLNANGSGGPDPNNNFFGFGSFINLSQGAQSFFASLNNTPSTNVGPNTPVTVNTPFALMGAFTPARVQACLNGVLGVAAGGTGGPLHPVVTLGLGIPMHFQLQPFFWFRRCELWPTSCLSDATMQALTTSPY